MKKKKIVCLNNNEMLSVIKLKTKMKMKKKTKIQNKTKTKKKTKMKIKTKPKPKPKTFSEKKFTSKMLCLNLEHLKKNSSRQMVKDCKKRDNATSRRDRSANFFFCCRRDRG